MITRLTKQRISGAKLTTFLLAAIIGIGCSRPMPPLAPWVPMVPSPNLSNGTSTESYANLCGTWPTADEQQLFSAGVYHLSSNPPAADIPVIPGGKVIANGSPRSWSSGDLGSQGQIVEGGIGKPAVLICAQSNIEGVLSFYRSELEKSGEYHYDTGDTYHGTESFFAAWGEIATHTAPEYSYSRTIQMRIRKTGDRTLIEVLDDEIRNSFH